MMMKLRRAVRHVTVAALALAAVAVVLLVAVLVACARGLAAAADRTHAHYLHTAERELARRRALVRARGPQ